MNRLPQPAPATINTARPGPFVSVSSEAFPTVEDRVETSTEVWAKDLRGLFELAKERFGDVSWEGEEDVNVGPGRSVRVWGHKAVIYARAPKAFKDRYFISRPFSRSRTSLRSPSPGFLPPSYQSRPASPPSSYFTRPSPRPSPRPRQSTLSVETFQSEGTIRANDDGVLRLTHGDTPELFRAQLEWLYTGEGFGDVVEWISAEDDTGLGGSIRDSLGRRGNINERRDKLGQDLTYMWRSKLYADVRIHLEPQDSPDSASEDSDDSTDSLSSTAIFTSHKFILASRSPYFASVLLNPSHFQPTTADIHLPTPPFTPAALHFCLGFMYAGHLDFSNRSFDLLTAFQIHRAAAYLQLDSLIGEIESRIVHDFCHGLDWDKCRCRRCPPRAARIWRFASASDVGAVVLATRARRYVLRGWGESWSREVGTADQKDRDDLVNDVISTITTKSVVSTFRSVEAVKARMENGIRARGREASIWVDDLEKMLEPIQNRARQFLVEEFAHIAEETELWDLVSGKGFNDDLLEHVGKEIVEAVNTPKGCVEGPRIYQALVSSILLKVDPNTLQTALPVRSRGRQQVETIKEGVLGNIRRRWMQVRDQRGFDGLDNWALKEISDEIDIPLEDLLSPLDTTPQKSVRKITTPNARSISRPTSRPSGPRSAVKPTPTREAASTSAALRTSRASVSSRPSTIRAGPSTPPDSTGLKRLRLSSSASTSSVGSPRSLVINTARAPVGSMTGPQARSPTAAKPGSTVSIGARRNVQRSGSPSPSQRTVPQPMSGPPRPLMTRATPKATPAPRSSSPVPIPSVASVRTTRTARSSATVSRPLRPTTVVKANTTSEAGPSRLRTVSTATDATTATNPSVRSKAPTITTNSRTPITARKSNPTLSKSASSNSLSKPPIPSTRVTAPPPGAPGRKQNSPAKLAVAVTRPRTSSVSTTASVRSKAPSVVSKAPTVTRTVRKVPSAMSLAPSVASRSSVVSRATPVASKTPTTCKPSVVSNAPAADRTPPTTTITRPAPKPTPPIPPKSASRIPQPAKSTQLSPPKLTDPSPSTRTRTASGVSTKSTRSRVGPTAFPISTHKTTLRSPSSSTDDAPEARTPRLSSLPAIEPIIRRDGSDVSDIILRAGETASSTASSPTKLPPSTASTRQPRRISTSSTHSTASALRLHPASAFDPPKRSINATLPTKDVPEGLTPFDGKGVALHVGIPCIVSLAKKRARFRAQVKYIGTMRGSRGPWIGIEVEDLDRFGVKTLPSGSTDGIHYFHSSQRPPSPRIDETRQARQRRIELIREGLRKKPKSHLIGLGLTLTAPGSGVDKGSGWIKRSTSPFVSDWSGFEKPRALFVRPSEVVFVMGAE